MHAPWHKRVLAFAAVVLYATVSWAALTSPDELARVEVIRRAILAVVKIQGTPAFSEFAEGPVWGSGFFYSPNRVVTNFHVIDGLRNITVTLQDGRTFPAQVFAVDRGIDIALLTVLGTSAPATLTFGSAKDLVPGQTAIVIGSPFGQRNLVSVGVISGKGPFEFAAQIGNPDVGLEIAEVIYTDARVEPGNSGGPLLDGQGRVVGVVDAVLGGPSGLGGLGLAIPADLVAQSIQDLERYGVPQRGYLGATLVDLSQLDPLLLRLAGLSSDLGAMVDQVEPGSPAAQAGLRGASRDRLGKLTTLGDVILAINGKPVRSRHDVIQEVARYRPGDTITLTIWRGNKKLDITVTLIARR